MPTYRPNVALLLLDRDDQLLICERFKIEGAWQFPQGGMDQGETPLEALHREVEEEVGLPPSSYEVLEWRAGYRYLFPPRLRNGKKDWFDGQQQTYFLCRLKDGAPPINVDQQPREFGSHTWVEPRLFDLRWLPPFKRQVHRQVLRDFFGVEV
ncbi:MAG: NUDIX domain-containing protein [Verrucomicrobiaceae bacterium]|nr:NUDIX domain-containing protein [Verrucomicrobiaceae bacterium]